MKSKSLLFLLTFLVACSPPDVGVAQISATSTLIQATLVLSSPTETLQATSSQMVLDDPSDPKIILETKSVVDPTAIPRATLAPDAWKDLPVIPEVSQPARDIYQRGLLLGNQPQHFSKVGDCQNILSYFLGVFEQPGEYKLGLDYAYLQETIDYYAGSFSRESYAVKGGYNVAAILTPMRADPDACNKNQSPLDCELAHWRPSIALVSLEEWWADRPVGEYAIYLDQAVTIMIDNGTLPILATRAGNTPHVYALNDAIARVAHQHDIPLWNFWGAIQGLPNHGLTEDGFHLTFARNMFDDPVRMKSAWPWRNLTALQVLEAVRLALESQ
jgi:hypothetical protein